MADGSITFATDLDNDKLEKKLSSIGGKIKKLEGELNQKKDTQSGIEKELDDAKKAALEIETTIKNLKAEMTSLRSATGVEGSLNPEQYAVALERQKSITAELKEQEAALAKQDKETERISNQYAKCTDQVMALSEKIDVQKETYGEIARQIEEINSKSSKMGLAIDTAGKHMDKFTERVKNLARRVLVFSVITMALRQMRTWMSKVIKTNDEATSAMARLKGALLTLAQPLVDMVIPAFTLLVDILTQAVSMVAQLLSNLFGKSIDQSKEAAENLYNEVDALEDTGKAAEDAEKSMASFDEINRLPEAKKTKEARGDDSLTPKFDFDTDMETTQLDSLLTVIEAIGASLLAWKLSDSFLDGIKTAVGLFLAIDGGIKLVKQTSDAWVNGVDWGNFWGMLGSGAEMTAGLALAFGRMGAGIGLVVTGITFLITAFRDAALNGWNLQNSLMAVAGIIATGLGIAALTGSIIPALVAAVAALLLYITIATGHGEELIEGVKQILKGFVDFFAGIFTGDIARAIEGVNGIFGGLKTVASAVLSGVRDLLLGFFDWLDEKTGGRFSGLIGLIKEIITTFFDWAIETFGALTDGLQKIFGGIITFLTGVFTADWDMAWQGVKDIFAGIWNTIVGVLGAAVNTIISGINWVIEKLNSISVDIPDWVPGLGGKTMGFNIPTLKEWEIPYLAKGAVIPPNREFMAVLGDQKSGTNIEAPVSEIEAAVARGMAKAGASGSGQVKIELVVSTKPGMAREMKFELDRESKRQGVKLVQGV